MPKKSFSPDVKILVLQHLEEDRHTLEEICMMFSVNMTTLYAWRALYRYGGVRPKKNKMYSEEGAACCRRLFNEELLHVRHSHQIWNSQFISIQKVVENRY